MTLTSTLGSPGIEIREIDNSIRLDSSTSTTIFVPGFASQGPVDEVMSIGTIGDFETIYGVPTNAAERYFYYTVKAILDGSGNGTQVLCSRLPYGEDGGDTVSNAYTMLAYPAIPVVRKNYGTTDAPVYYDFDQFAFENDTAKETLASYFTVDSIEPTIEEFVLTTDDDSEIDFLKFTSIDTGTTVPETTAQCFTEDGEENPGITAPEISFDGDITAKGLIALDYKDVYYIHLSYTLIKTTVNDSSIKVGSMYMKLKYDTTTSIAGETITGAESITDDLTAKLKEAFEITESYTGDSEDGTTSERITYLVGSPVTYQVSLSKYYKIITGESLKWSKKPHDFTSSDDTEIDESENTDETSQGAFRHFDALGHAAFIVINTSRSIVNNNFEGFYLGLTDNMFATPSEDYEFNAIENVKVITKTYDEIENGKLGLIDKIDNTGDFQTISTNRLSFYLNNNYQGSVSRVLSRNITTMDISGTDYDDTLNMALFKLSKSSDSSDILKLNYSIREKYNWSFDKSRLKSAVGSTKPVSAFVENVVENSNNLTILMNPYISTKTFVDLDGDIKGKIRVFGTKLLNNLEYFEQKYLRRDYSDISENVAYTKKNVSAMVPATLAKSSINSWASMVKQAGVSPHFIKSNLKNYNLENVAGEPETIEGEETSHTYYNFHPLNSLIPFGTYTEPTMGNKIIGHLPEKLRRALELVENDEQYPDIDLILEGGLGTIYAYTTTDTISSEGASSRVLMDEYTGNYSIDGVEKPNKKKQEFDETAIIQGIEDLRTGRTSLSDDAQEFIENYNDVQNTFLGFANSMQNGGRGDTFYISDIPRGILIKGKNTKITNLYGAILENNVYDFGQNVKHSFSTSIYYPIKHVFDNIVSSYMSTYAQWVKISDYHSSEKVWIPISGYIAANMAATDGTYGPWYAAAGLRRGVISGVLDYALSPAITQRTDLYKICINSVPKIPNYGVTIYGIRTMSKKDSAFDQNTCRRTFLYMEKKVKQLLRYYIFEPNISYTRLQIYNDIYPFLEKIKNSGGIYAYTLVCDATNNTPDIINNGDLAVSISAAPTRTAENIIVEFIANKVTDEITASESMN